MSVISGHATPDVLFLAMQSRDKGASSWLNAIPLKDQGLALNNQQIRDSLRMRYNLPLNDMPSHCACGDRFNINHAITCKKGVSWRKGMTEFATCSPRYLVKCVRTWK
jgi:hypothetical protein